MQHTTDDDLILHYYGEIEGGDHVAACPDCRSRLHTLQRALNSVDIPVPERPSDYEERVWDRLSPKIGARSWWRMPRQWLAIAALASLVTAAFVLGRYSPAVLPIAHEEAAVRDRVLIVAVGDHLERSQIVLAELVNAAPQNTRQSIRLERSLAESLLTPNRLYRQTAMTAGDAATATLLDDLERVLLEVARSPEAISSEDLDELRNRVEQQGLLFRIRVTNTTLRDRLGAPAPAAEQL